jgi:outer membrane protein assembly factor BamB
MSTTPLARLIAFPLLFAAALVGGAADWPCWRGPDGLGVSSEKGFPVHWSKSENVRFSVDIPGRGSSSPAVVGDRLYVTTQTDDTGMHVLALNAATGAVLWDTEVGRGKVRAHKLHNMATPSPVADAGHVWVRFGTGVVACLDTSGRIVWQRNLSAEYGEYNANHGLGTSPMLDQGRLFIACMHQAPSYLLALDPATGKNLWKKDRNLGPKDEAQDSYSSPIFVRSGGRTQLVLAGAEAVNAYDPATGDQLWIHGGLKVPHPYGRTISGPAAGDGVIVVVASGFQNQGFTIGLKAEGRGDRPESDRLWTSRKYSADCSTPLVYRGNVYAVRDDGMASCLDVRTGEPHWQERLFTGNVKVSPVAADGLVYFTSGQATCYVVKASPRMEVVATNEVNEFTQATPALSRGRVYQRTESRLYCFGK